MRIVAAVIALIMLCSCSVNSQKPPVIADGFSCRVTADFGEYENELKLKREGSVFYIEYLSPDDLNGIVYDISPAGSLVKFDEISNAINKDLLNESLVGQIITALKYDYQQAEYTDGRYICPDFNVSLFSDGKISEINFLKLNCRCYFNY